MNRFVLGNSLLSNVVNSEIKVITNLTWIHLRRLRTKQILSGD